MNIRSSMNIETLRKEFQSRLTDSSETDGIHHDAFMLMAGYLSEIERIQEERQINRKELAKLINTSPSYLTQVFRGSKPLNFETIAKIQRVLNIRFDLFAVEQAYKSSDRKMTRIMKLKKV